MFSEQRRQELKQLFPRVFAEAIDNDGNPVETVDFARLQAEPGTFTDVYEGRRERYLKWMLQSAHTIQTRPW